MAVVDVVRLRGVKYPAQERQWVRDILRRLNADQRRRYEEACKVAPRHHNSGKLYDGAKAEIAERILYEDSLATEVTW